MPANKAMLGALGLLAIFLLAFVVPAGLYVPMLRVTFQKGLALSVLRYVITISIFAAFGLAIVAATGKHKFYRASLRDDLLAPRQVVPHDVAIQFATRDEEHPPLGRLG